MQHVPFWKVIIGAVIFFLSFVSIEGGGRICVLYTISCSDHLFDISNYSSPFLSLAWLFLSSATYMPGWGRNIYVLLPVHLVIVFCFLFSCGRVNAHVAPPF